MFEQRSMKPELIDASDCDVSTVRQSHAFMRWVNRFFGGTAAVKAFIREAAAAHTSDRPLEILDIGAGTGDIAHCATAWAQRRGIAVRFTCIEKDVTAMELGKLRDETSSIEYVNTDVFEYHPNRCFDYATASMVLHHFDAAQIAALLRHLRPFVRKGLFVNDLHRSMFTYASCLAVCPFLPADVRHDALISIKKGFTPSDLAALPAGPEATITVQRRRWGRVTALIQWKGEN